MESSSKQNGYNASISVSHLDLEKKLAHLRDDSVTELNEEQEKADTQSEKRRHYMSESVRAKSVLV